MDLHGLMHTWLLGVPHQMITLFSMYRDGKELDNFTRGRKKYNEMENNMKLVERSSKRVGRWDRE